ncbi:MAG: LytTR family transcriptional regulator [Cytophagaceae bacterium]|jgi:hypothetical protein|nr:LytTR family transcriptional regulator [Cytophagaceae bacterium]
MSKIIPDYFISKKNSVIQICFTTVFAYAFINLYKPFGADQWYDVTHGVFSLASGILVLSGMLVVLASRLIMFAVKRRHTVTVIYYITMIAGEILFMAILYALIEKLALHDIRPFAVLVYNAVQNTSSILLIPYLISLLFFAWQEKKMMLEKMNRQLNNNASFIPFKDVRGILRITLKTADVIFLQANDNYVTIYCETDGKAKSYLLRNTLKQLEQELKDFPLLRCHRSFTVNINHVKMMKSEKGSVQLFMDNLCTHTIPVSRSYADSVTKLFASNAIKLFGK